MPNKDFLDVQSKYLQEMWSGSVYPNTEIRYHLNEFFWNRKKKKEKLLKKLTAEKEQCKTDACKEKIQEKIDKLYGKKRERGGGFVMNSLSDLLQYLADSANVKGDNKNLRALLLLKKEADNCKDSKCQQSIINKINSLKGPYKVELKKN